MLFSRQIHANEYMKVSVQEEVENEWNIEMFGWEQAAPTGLEVEETSMNEEL